MVEQTDATGPSGSESGFDIELLLRQARAYLEFGEQIQAFNARFDQTARQQGDWGTALRQQLEQLQGALNGAAGETSGAQPGLAQFWTVTLDAWQQAAAAAGVPATPPTAATGADQAAWSEYQRVQDDYLALLRQAAHAALDLLEQRLHERAATGAEVKTLRGLYNLWVECNEETYGRMLRGAEYGVVNGRLLNALLGCYRPGGSPL